MKTNEGKNNILDRTNFPLHHRMSDPSGDLGRSFHFFINGENQTKKRDRKEWAIVLREKQIEAWKSFHATCTFSSRPPIHKLIDFFASTFAVRSLLYFVVYRPFKSITWQKVFFRLHSPFVDLRKFDQVQSAGVRVQIERVRHRIDMFFSGDLFSVSYVYRVRFSSFHSIHQSCISFTDFQNKFLRELPIGSRRVFLWSLRVSKIDDQHRLPHSVHWFYENRCSERKFC